MYAIRSYYARKALRGDVPARKRMIEYNLRLVVKITSLYNQVIRVYHMHI